MKKILILSFLLLNTIFVKGRESTTNGITNLNKVTVNSLKHNGQLTFNNLTIKNKLNINGKLQGKNLTCNNLQSNGSLNVDTLQATNIKHNGSFIAKNIIVSEKLECHGRTNIINGTLNDVEVKGKTITFEDSKVRKNIFIKTSTNSWSFFGFTFKESKSPSILELKGKSLVLGDITFEDEGTIYVFDSSKIKGKVINAKIIRE